MRAEDTLRCWEARAVSTPRSPTLRQEQASCLPGLAMGGAGSVHLSPWSEEQGSHTALPRADEPWRLRGEGTEATARSEEGTCSWRALAWRGVVGRHSLADDEGEERSTGA